MNENGDGVIGARLSSLDIQKGESALCAVVALRTSGGRYELR